MILAGCVLMIKPVLIGIVLCGVSAVVALSRHEHTPSVRRRR